MEDYKDHLERLKKLNLKTCTTYEIRELMNTIGKLPVINTTYSKGKVIERAVTIEADVQDYTTAGRISTKPANLNKEYARASTPDSTMFYGCAVDTNSFNAEGRFTEVDLARIAGCTEVCQLLRDSTIESGDALIIVGKWRVTGDLNLMTVFNPNKDYGVKYINDVKNHLLQEIEKIEDESLREKALDYYEFFGTEFGKEVDVRPEKKKQYEYKVSAELTKTLCDAFDGVIYPSVRADGIGLCVAIKPTSAEKHLELIEVSKLYIHKANGDVPIRYVGKCLVEPPNSDYEILPIEEFRKRLKG